MNNWNEERQLADEEQRYVTELINDLIQDSIALKALMDEATKIGRSKSILVKYLDDPSQIPDSLPYHHYTQWFSVQKFTPITTTIDEIKSGIGLGIIRDDRLRRSLVSLYNDFDQWQVDGEVFQKSLDVFFRLSRVHLENINAPTKIEIIELLNIPEVSNVIRTNYANSRKRAIAEQMEHTQNLLSELRIYQEKITR